MSNNLDNKLSNARDGVTQIGKDLRADAHSAIDRTADKVPPMTDRAASFAHSSVDKVADGVEKAADTVESASTSVLERGKKIGVAYKQFAETGRGYVRTSPAISVLLAAAAGYGLSKLLGARGK
ncbi:hypothetical protein HSX11_02140 [Oxalobacteraceae bacterium]|nr:hypothetical protein [Oxalobacteraceae bacterium]